MHVGIVQNRLFTDGTLKFKHHQRQTVDIQNAIGDALFCAFNFQLIDDAITIATVIVINQLDKQILLRMVITFEHEAIGDQLMDGTIGVIQIRRAEID